MLQSMHKTFVHVHMEEARKRNKDRYDRKAESKNVTVQDPVYYQDMVCHRTDILHWGNGRRNLHVLV